VIVVTDTSVVLNLCWLHQESLLPAIYEDVLAPGQVRLEFERKATTDPRFAGLRFPPFITLAEPAAIPAILATNPDLDPGEIAALALALERGIADVLIDEKSGRAAAIALGLHVSGLLGVLIEGKQRRLVPALRPLIDTLVVDARFWIDPGLREHVLLLADENPES
jgi:predicted nucleic acid-binding protein